MLRRRHERKQPHSTHDEDGYTTCPDCLTRNAVTLDGRPRFVSGSMLTAGCEGCGGSGRIKVETATLGRHQRRSRPERRSPQIGAAR